MYVFKSVLLLALLISNDGVNASVIERNVDNPELLKEFEPLDVVQKLDHSKITGTV